LHADHHFAEHRCNKAACEQGINRCLKYIAENITAHLHAPMIWPSFSMEMGLGKKSLKRPASTPALTPALTHTRKGGFQPTRELLEDEKDSAKKQKPLPNVSNRQGRSTSVHDRHLEVHEQHQIVVPLFAKLHKPQKCIEPVFRARNLHASSRLCKSIQRLFQHSQVHQIVLRNLY
jgi:hypothetical protein